MILATVGAQESLGCARPVDPGRDMGAIADLIEIAFAGELDRSANSLVADMRHLAMLGPLLLIADRVAPIPSGYVWEQAGRLVGNATVTLENATRRRWFISNVAVHPDHRGQGIGRRLMETALAGIRRQGGQQVLLQVRTENEPAQRLYRRLRFQRFDTLVELLRPGWLPAPPAPQLSLRRLRTPDWRALFDLAVAATPPEVQRIRALAPQAFRPTLGRRLQEWLDGFFGGRQRARWGLEEAGALAAVVGVQAYGDGGPLRLDLTVRPARRGALEGPLADWGLIRLAAWGPRGVAANVSASHPEALRALRERHFVSGRSLDQLVLRL